MLTIHRHASVRGTKWNDPNLPSYRFLFCQSFHWLLLQTSKYRYQMHMQWHMHATWDHYRAIFHGFWTIVPIVYIISPNVNHKYDLNYLVFKWFHVARKKLFTISIVDISVFNWCNLIGMLVYLPCARFKQIRMFQLTVSIKFL